MRFYHRSRAVNHGILYFIPRSSGSFCLAGEAGDRLWKVGKVCSSRYTAECDEAEDCGYKLHDFAMNLSF